ncbi:unnamed protein product [Rangifer tarandus platyrhynchus]|uniref:Uncharacterized protein n=1 Tax=Rangifer tarandus platyrhynchus TaxID=3082113 RepID=A0ABN8Y9Q7_RANTA|nr:unnamed protein product [Rangifer tarandus platyrhynchus]
MALRGWGHWSGRPAEVRLLSWGVGERAEHVRGGESVGQPQGEAQGAEAASPAAPAQVEVSRVLHGASPEQGTRLATRPRTAPGTAWGGGLRARRPGRPVPATCPAPPPAGGQGLPAPLPAPPAGVLLSPSVLLSQLTPSSLGGGGGPAGRALHGLHTCRRTRVHGHAGAAHAAPPVSLGPPSGRRAPGSDETQAHPQRG